MPGCTRKDWQARSASSEDAEAIVALMNAHARRHCGEDRIGADEVLTWFKSQGEPQDDTRSWWLRDGTMAAFAQIYPPEFPSFWDVLHDATVHPDISEDETLWKDVFSWCERHQWTARRKGATPGTGLKAGARVLENDADKRRQYESKGFRQVRSETLMRVRIEDVAWGDGTAPEGIEIRRLDRRKDIDGYALAYAEAFRDHWGHTDFPHDEWVRRKEAEFEAWGDMFVPDLWFVALDGDTLVGSVGSFPDHGNVKGRCYLYHVFVRREWRNRRIASALMRTAFRALRDRGGRTIELHVDSENMTYGLELYRGLGMKPAWQQALYEKTYDERQRDPERAAPQ